MKGTRLTLNPKTKRSTKRPCFLSRSVYPIDSRDPDKIRIIPEIREKLSRSVYPIDSRDLDKIRIIPELREK